MSLELFKALISNTLLRWWLWGCVSKVSVGKAIVILTMSTQYCLYNTFWGKTISLPPGTGAGPPHGQRRARGNVLVGPVSRQKILSSQAHHSLPKSLGEGGKIQWDGLKSPGPLWLLKSMVPKLSSPQTPGITFHNPVFPHSSYVDI